MRLNLRQHYILLIATMRTVKLACAWNSKLSYRTFVFCNLLRCILDIIQLTFQLPSEGRCLELNGGKSFHNSEKKNGRLNRFVYAIPAAFIYSPGRFEPTSAQPGWQTLIQFDKINCFISAATLLSH